MAQHSELPVYKATYDLLLAIFQFTKDFSREYKYTVGESLKKETIELLDLFYRAIYQNYTEDLIQKKARQFVARIKQKLIPVLPIKFLIQVNKSGFINSIRV